MSPFRGILPYVNLLTPTTLNWPLWLLVNSHLLLLLEGQEQILNMSNSVSPQTKAPVPYTNATQQLGRVVISWHIGPGLTTTVGSISATDPSGRET